MIEEEIIDCFDCCCARAYSSVFLWADPANLWWFFVTLPISKVCQSQSCITLPNSHNLIGPYSYLSCCLEALTQVIRYCCSGASFWIELDEIWVGWVAKMMELYGLFQRCKASLAAVEGIYELSGLSASWCCGWERKCKWARRAGMFFKITCDYDC